MTRRRWLVQIIIASLLWRRGRSLLLIGVLTMATSLLTALAIVSLSMEKRIGEEVRRYGANLLIIPESAPLDVGSGGLNFGLISEPAFLDQPSVLQALSRGGEGLTGYSLHLRGMLTLNGRSIAAEGVHFAEIRKIFPWWQIQGGWPGKDEVLLGSDLARTLSLSPGDMVELKGEQGAATVRIGGTVISGGDEEKLLFADLEQFQGLLGLDRKISIVRVLASVEGGKTAAVAERLKGGVTGAVVREVRQITGSSETLLKKVQFLMLLVTAVVLLTCGGSVAGTMSTIILERGKEIGLLKAMGGSRQDILLIFSGEAFFLGIVGGVVGYPAGYAIAALVTGTVFAAPAIFSPWLLAVAPAASLLLAMLGSLGPMMAVYRLNPVASLRGE